MQLRTGVAQAAIVAFSALLIVPATPLARAQGDTRKPSLSLKATPAVSFAPARVVVVAEVKGGAEDNEEFYCPTVEWEWGDLTTSTVEADCEPYETGKSQIKRRYTVEHRYKNPGGFRIRLLLKKGSKIIGTANTLVQVRPGLGDPGR
jgi:plastocyanin